MLYDNPALLDFSSTATNSSPDALLEELRVSYVQMQALCTTDVGLEMVDIRRGYDYLKSLVTKSREFVAGLKEQNEELHVPLIFKREMKLLTTVAGQNYMALRPIELYKPLGLNVTFLALTDVLVKYMPVFDKLEEEQFSALSKWITNLLTNPMEMAKLAPKSVLQIDSPDDIIKDFKQCFGGKDGVDRESFGALFGRVNDVSTVCDRVEKLTAVFNKKNYRRFNEHLEGVIKLVDELVESSKRDPEAFPVSKPVAEVFARTIYNLAQLVNCYSLYLTKLLALITALKDSGERMEEVLGIAKK
jgi:hypothetical protein